MSNKKILVFSDLHLKPETSELIFNKIFPDMLSICLSNSINTIICCGDIWEQRYRVPILEQLLLYRWFMTLQKNNIEIHILVGNHDQIDITGNNSLEVFNSVENVHVYSEPTINALGGWIPYRKDINEFKSYVEHMEINNVKRLFIHQDIKSALLNINKTSEIGIDYQYLKNFEIVLAGHFHLPSNIGRNIHYVGSIYATKKDEINNPHRYIILEDNNYLQSISVNYGHIFNDIVSNINKKPLPIEQRLAISKSASLQDYAEAYLTNKISDKKIISFYKSIFNRITSNAI